VRPEEGFVDGLQLRVDALVLAVEGDVDVAGARTFRPTLAARSYQSFSVR
jgi:hypothetical protein